MRYNVAQLLKRPIGTRRHYDVNKKIGSLDQELELVRPLVGPIILTRINQGILVTGRLRTELQVACRRCLEPCNAKVELELEEEFYPIAPIGGASGDNGPEEGLDEALSIDEHHTLDLGEVVRQALWVAAPMEALCRPDCAGLCPQCGGNRNLGECSCNQTPIDPRWIALQALISDESDSNERSD
ncbi:DUF177 domain-containing protein [Chloroflexota bacterium]